MSKAQDPDLPPEGYAALLAEAKEQVRRAHISAARRVNSELVLMYLGLARLILDRQADEGWDTRVIHHLARDPSAAFPGQRGFSERNLRYCRTAARMFAAPIGPQLVAQLAWGHVRTLTDKVDDELRLWYAAQAAQRGWSRNVLEHHIDSALHARAAHSPTPARIPVAGVDSDLVRDLVQDPYRLDYLELDPGHSERQLENAMAHRMTAPLAELGPGFAFVGRQRIATSSRSRRFSTFNRLISTCSSVVTPSRRPASTSAWATHRRTDSRPTPTCLATAADAAVTDGYSLTCSDTNRTARARTSGSIFLGMVLLLPTHKDAARNLGRFMVR